MMREYHVRFREGFGGEIPPYLLDLRHEFTLLALNQYIMQTFEIIALSKS